MSRRPLQPPEKIRRKTQEHSHTRYLPSAASVLLMTDKILLPLWSSYSDNGKETTNRANTEQIRLHLSALKEIIYM